MLVDEFVICLARNYFTKDGATLSNLLYRFKYIFSGSIEYQVGHFPARPDRLVEVLVVMQKEHLLTQPNFRKLLPVFMRSPQALAFGLRALEAARAICVSNGQSAE